MYIITNTLMEKLGIEKQLEVANHKKMMSIAIIKNLKITIGGLTFNITVTVIKVESQENNYSMLLGWSWLKQAHA